MPLTSIRPRPKGRDNTVVMTDQPEGSSVIASPPSQEETFADFYQSLSPVVKEGLGRDLQGPIRNLRGGEGRMKPYLRGALVIHATYGQLYLYGSIYQKWKKSGWERGFLGSPVTNLGKTRGREFVEFEKGIVYSGTRTVEVHGRIYERYCLLRRERGFLGFPVRDELATTGVKGAGSLFEKGSIYWSPRSGAHEVHGEIHRKWRALGGHKSIVGFPLSDQTPVGKTAARFNRFQNGTVYWSNKTGAREVRGHILLEWEKMGGVTGWMGLPTSDETLSPKKTVRYNTFQNGMVVWSSKRGALAMKELHCYLDRFGSKGSDRWGAGAGQEVYVHAKVYASNGVLFKKRMPRKGSYGSSKEIDKTILRIKQIKPNSWIETTFKGKDEDDYNADDHLGTVSRKYTLDNFFGIFDQHSRWNGNFQVVYSIKPIIPLDADKPFRHQYWWPFNNFKTKRLSKSQFAQTFRDVDQGEKWWLNSANALFYQTIYKGVASKGNCFGMSLESIYARIGKSVFAEPIYRWGKEKGDPRPDQDRSIINEINIKHGYQIGASCIEWAAGQFFSGSTHNPEDVFKDTRRDYNSGNYPVLVVTPKILRIGAHVVLPYKFEDIKKDGKVVTRRIYVADPNREWKNDLVKNPDKSAIADPSFVDINPANNTFSYKHGENDYWRGSRRSGGRMYRIPLSQLDSQPVTPLWGILARLVEGGIFLVAGDADTEQITDQQGGTLFKKNLRRAVRWEDFNNDSHTRLSHISPIPIMDMAGKTPELYFMKGSRNHLLRHAIRGAGGQYTTMLKTPAATTYAQLPAARGARDLIISRGISTAAQSLELNTSEAGKTATLGIQTALNAKSDFRLGELRGVPLVKDRPVTVRFNAAKDAVLLDNKGGNGRVALKMETRINGSMKSKWLTHVPVEAGKVLRIRPQSWSTLSTGRFHFDVLERENGPVIRRFKK